jgi:hypothetical protein
MSATQSWFGPSAVNLRSTRSGAGRASLSRRVVTGPCRLRLAPTRPASRLRRAIRLRPCVSPPARSSACPRGDPWISPEVACTVRIRFGSAASAWACSDAGRRNQASKPARDTPRTPAMMLTGKVAWFALMNRTTRTGSGRSRAQTRPRRERECRAPRGAACSRAAAGPTHRARPQSGGRPPPQASPPAGPPVGPPAPPVKRMRLTGSPARRARTRGRGRQGRGRHAQHHPSGAGTQGHTGDGSSASGHLSRKRVWCPRNRGNFNMRQYQTGPGIAVEHAVEGGQARVLGQAKGARAVRHRARPDGQQRPHGQRRRGGAGPSREDGEIRREPGEKAGRKVKLGADHDGPAGLCW